MYVQKGRVTEFYRVHSLTKNECEVSKFVTFNPSFKPCDLEWTDVGLHEANGVWPAKDMLELKEITGKAMIVGRYLITCPRALLRYIV